MGHAGMVKAKRLGKDGSRRELDHVVFEQSDSVAVALEGVAAVSGSKQLVILTVTA